MTRTGILVALSVFSLSLWASAECPTCNGCQDQCIQHGGWTKSPTFGNCSAPKDCGVAVRLSESYLDSAHPGLFARVERGDLVVTGVVPASPADEAGILVGDRILALNGEVPTNSCSAHQWSSADDPGFADIVLSHRGIERHLKLGLAPVRQILAKPGRKAPAQCQYPCRLFTSRARVGGRSDLDGRRDQASLMLPTSWRHRRHSELDS
jgi:hypothetical protein